MKKIFIFLSFIIGVFYFYSCEIDNYAEPDMTIEGKVVDIQTNENIQTRQPNGIKIRLTEEGYPTPYDFWTKADGSFKNTKLPAARYQVVAMEGPFDDISAESVDLNTNQTNVIFKVTPYARFSNVSITASGTTITATYKVAKSSTKALKTCVLMAYTSVQVHEATTGVTKSSTIDLSGYSDADLATTTFTSTISGLTSGTTYYARVGVLTNNSLSRYNYSPVIEVKIP
jgi:hypothetical protein